jgi:hypothetical protein
VFHEHQSINANNIAVHNNQETEDKQMYLEYHAIIKAGRTAVIYIVYCIV